MERRSPAFGSVAASREERGGDPSLLKTEDGSRRQTWNCLFLSLLDALPRRYVRGREANSAGHASLLHPSH